MVIEPISSAHPMATDSSMSTTIPSFSIPIFENLTKFNYRVMRAGHHQRTKVALVPETVEHARLMLFPLVRRLGRSTDRPRLHVPLRGSSL
jgi:hypothetical protein